MELVHFRLRKISRAVELISHFSVTSFAVILFRERLIKYGKHPIYTEQLVYVRHQIRQIAD